MALEDGNRFTTENMSSEAASAVLVVQCFWDNLPSMSIPDTDAGIKTSRNNPVPVKGDGINLAEMPGQSVQALSLGDAPDLRSGVITTRHHYITSDLQAPNASLVPDKNVPADALTNVPDPQRRVARAGNSRIRI